MRQSIVARSRPLETRVSGSMTGSYRSDSRFSKCEFREAKDYVQPAAVAVLVEVFVLMGQRTLPFDPERLARLVSGHL